MGIANVPCAILHACVRHACWNTVIVSNAPFSMFVIQESICWRSLGAQTWRTWHPTHASCCRSAQSYANWTRWSVTWPPSVSCRWLHDRGHARRRISWHPGKTCMHVQYVHTRVAQIFMYNHADLHSWCIKKRVYHWEHLCSSEYSYSQDADLWAVWYVSQGLLFVRKKSSFLFCLSKLHSSVFVL